MSAEESPVSRYDPVSRTSPNRSLGRRKQRVHQARFRLIIARIVLGDRSGTRSASEWKTGTATERFAKIIKIY